MQRLLGLICISALYLVISACGGSGGDGTSWTNSLQDSSTAVKLAVTATAPAANQANIPPNSAISVTFSNPLQPGTITNDTFIVINGTSVVPGIVSCLGNSAIFKPFAPLSSNTTYTATIKKTVKDNSGNIMAQDMTWSFATGTTVDTTPPHIFATNPMDSSVTVLANSTILVTFSEPVDPTTVNASSFTVNGPNGPVSGSLATSGINTSFTPDALFTVPATYTVSVTRGVKDLAGNPLSTAKTIKFTTSDPPDYSPPIVSSTSPVNRTTGFDIFSPITISFNEAVNPLSVTSDKIGVTVDATGAAVSGTITVNQNLVSFTPLTELLPFTTYRVAVKPGIKDLAGNQISGTTTFIFTTGPSLVLSLTTNDIIYNKFDGKIYASVPSSVVGIGNTVTVIDPATRTIGQSISVGSEPMKLALSADGKYLYVGLDGTGGVSRINLTTMTKDLTFSLPVGLFVDDMAVVPGNPNAVAIARKLKGVSPAHAGVAVYDVTPPSTGTARAAVTNPNQYISSSITFSDTTGALYGYNNETTGFEFQVMNIGAGGVTVTSSTSNLLDFFNTYITFAAGRVYSTQGHIVDVTVTPPVLSGTISRSNFFDSVCPDVANGKIFYLSSFSKEVLVYDSATLAKLGSISLSSISGFSPSSLIRWGTNGLAFRTDANQVFILTTSLLP